MQTYRTKYISRVTQTQARKLTLSYFCWLHETSSFNWPTSEGCVYATWGAQTLFLKGLECQSCRHDSEPSMAPVGPDFVSSLSLGEYHFLGWGILRISRLWPQALYTSFCVVLSQSEGRYDGSCSLCSFLHSFWWSFHPFNRCSRGFDPVTQVWQYLPGDSLDPTSWGLSPTRMPPPPLRCQS